MNNHCLSFLLKDFGALYGVKPQPLTTQSHDKWGAVLWGLLFCGWACRSLSWQMICFMPVIRAISRADLYQGKNHNIRRGEGQILLSVIPPLMPTNSSWKDHPPIMHQRIQHPLGLDICPKKVKCPRKKPTGNPSLLHKTYLDIRWKCSTFFHHLKRIV